MKRRVVSGKVFREYRKSGYYVSAMGKVIGRANKILRPGLAGGANGYPAVDIPVPKRKSMKIHLMVAECWLGKKPRGMIVNHKDGNKRNYRRSNLEYTTNSGNVDHALDTGLQKHGGDRSWSAVTNVVALKIVKRIKSGERNVDIAERFDVPPYIVRDIKSGKAYKRALQERGVKYPIVGTSQQPNLGRCHMQSTITIKALG